MKRFKSYAPEQGYLLPPAPKEWLPAGHLAHFIDDVVDELDLSAIYAAYKEERGQPPFHPRMMVKVWLYGYCMGIRSSRKLERALWEDVGFRMLSGNQQPDHWTLSQFRHRHPGCDSLGDPHDDQTLRLHICPVMQRTSARPERSSARPGSRSWDPWKSVARLCFQPITRIPRKKV